MPTLYNDIFYFCNNCIEKCKITVKNQVPEYCPKFQGKKVHFEVLDD